MTDPTPDEAAAALQAVLDAGGRHCGCDPELYDDSDFIGFVSDTNGRGHREVRGAAIRVLLAERKQLHRRLANPCDGERCEVGGAAHCHRCAEAEADKLLAERDLVRAHVDILVRHLAGCAKQADSAFWSDLARDLADPQFRTEYFSRAAQVVALNADTETLGG